MCFRLKNNLAWESGSTITMGWELAGDTATDEYSPARTNVCLFVCSYKGGGTFAERNCGLLLDYLLTLNTIAVSRIANRSLSGSVSFFRLWMDLKAFSLKRL